MSDMRSAATMAQPRAIQMLQRAYDALQRMEELRVEVRLQEARATGLELVREFPDYWAALHTLGLVHSDLHDHEAALGCLVRAMMLAPTNPATLTALGSVYINLGAFDLAQETLEKSLALEPENPNTLCMLGELHQKRQSYTSAAAFYREAHSRDPALPAALLGLGRCLVELGDLAGATRAFEALHRFSPELLDPIAELASLPARFVQTNLSEALERVTCEALRDEVDFDATRELTRALIAEAAGDHATAWRSTCAAKKRLTAQRTTALAQEQQTQAAALAALRELQPGGQALPPARAEGPMPLFILGPSRSGKTTLESILARDPSISRGFESSVVSQSVFRVMQDAGLPGADRLDVMPRQLHPVFRERLLAEVAAAAPDARLRTITNPLNIHEASRLLRLVPEARMVLVKRNIDDTVLRIFMRDYQHDNAYAYDIAAAYAHVRWYHEMIDLLAAAFPDHVRVVAYETMVGEPRQAIDVVSRLCGLSLDVPAPAVGDDRGCARAYATFMQAAVAGRA